jgi:hypothetical protein
MAAEIGTARPCLSQQRRATSNEWLIVARWGRDGEYLTVSRTGMGRGAGSTAPINLAPTTTCIGMLTPYGDEYGGDEHGHDMHGSSVSDLFTLTRHLPEGVTVAGVFTPAEGFIRLRGPVEAMLLTASARDTGGRTVPVDAASRDLRTRIGIDVDPVSTWNIRASRQPWDGEFIEPVELLTC